MSDSRFTRVYQCTFTGKRFMLVFIRPNKRLPIEPMYQLAAEVVFDPINGEYHSFVFDHRFKYEIKKEVYSFMNSAPVDSDFRALCRESYNNFIDLISRSERVVSDEQYLGFEFENKV